MVFSIKCTLFCSHGKRVWSFEYEGLPDNDDMLRVNDPLWENASIAMASNMVDGL